MSGITKCIDFGGIAAQKDLAELEVFELNRWDFAPPPPDVVWHLGCLSAFSMTSALMLLLLPGLQVSLDHFCFIWRTEFVPSHPSLNFTSARELPETEGGYAFPPSVWKLVYPKSIFAFSRTLFWGWKEPPNDKCALWVIRFPSLSFLAFWIVWTN